jgi:hypothetical protein
VRVLLIIPLVCRAQTLHDLLWPTLNLQVPVFSLQGLLHPLMTLLS